MEFVDLEERGDHVAQLTINRPDALNALNEQVLEDLHDAARKLTGHKDLRAVIVTGAGRAFVAGADIKAMREMDAEQAEAFSRRGHEVMNAIAHIPAPVLAAVHGFALGGGLELALACDLIYASTEAKFGLPEVGLGLIPGFGGTQRLGRLINRHAARELVLTGRTIDAQEAYRIGLALRVFEPDALLDEVSAVADQIVGRGPHAVRAAKRVMARGHDMDLAAALAREQETFGKLFVHDEPEEGLSAHLERRDPNF